jgi:phage/plasmid-like protein (TIGR03299 family)
MSHGMTEHDSAVFFKKPAWHGLGNVVEEDLSVQRALIESGLDWDVVKRKIVADGIESTDHKALIRTDINKILGIVSNRYQVIQNQEVFRLAEHFGNSVKVESAGSIETGKRNYLLLRGDTFNVGSGVHDPVDKYMAMFWGHDGTTSVVVTPTSIRVQCKNTLEMLANESENTSNKVVIKHAGDISEKLHYVTEAIDKFKNTGRFFEEQTNYLSSRQLSPRELNQFFLEMYTRLNRTSIVMNPVTEKEESDKVRALTTISSWTEILENENLGSNYWTATNAVTNRIQHADGARGRKKTPASRAYSNLNGKANTDSSTVFKAALSLAG